jgi:hypothetical protein
MPYSLQSRICSQIRRVTMGGEDAVQLTVTGYEDDGTAQLLLAALGEMGFAIKVVDRGQIDTHITDCDDISLGDDVEAMKRELYSLVPSTPLVVEGRIFFRKS